MRRSFSPDGFDKVRVVARSSLLSWKLSSCSVSRILSGKVYLTSVGRKETCLKGSALLLALSRAGGMYPVSSPLANLVSFKRLDTPLANHVEKSPAGRFRPAAILVLHASDRRQAESSVRRVGVRRLDEAMMAGTACPGCGELPVRDETWRDGSYCDGPSGNRTSNNRDSSVRAMHQMSSSGLRRSDT